MNHRATPLLRIAALCLPLLIAACGGGGSGTPPDAGGTTFDPARLQGRWTRADATGTPYTAIIAPGATGAAQGWMLAHDGSSLVRMTLGSDLTVSGKRYALATPGAPATALAAARYAPRLELSPPQVALQGVPDATSSTTLRLDDGLAATASLADAAGGWQASAGAAALAWTLSGSGAISGSSTTGCVYAGNATAPAGVRIYTVQVTETCSGVGTPLTGIATLSTDRSRLTLVATTTDESRGVAVFFARP